jgi:hypothetical protein
MCTVWKCTRISAGDHDNQLEGTQGINVRFEIITMVTVGYNYVYFGESDVSGEHVASIFRDEEWDKQETSMKQAASRELHVSIRTYVHPVLLDQGLATQLASVRLTNKNELLTYSVPWNSLLSTCFLLVSCLVCFSTLKIEAACSFETSGSLRPTCYNPEYRTLQNNNASKSHDGYQSKNIYFRVPKKPNHIRRLWELFSHKCKGKVVPVHAGVEV